LPAASAGVLVFGGINQLTTAVDNLIDLFTLVSDDGNSATVEQNPLLIIDLQIFQRKLQQYYLSVGPTTAAFLGNLYGRARHASNAAAATKIIYYPQQRVIATIQGGAPAPF
jgi:hypothetical protein